MSKEFIHLFGPLCIIEDKVRLSLKCDGTRAETRFRHKWSDCGILLENDLVL